MFDGGVDVQAPQLVGFVRNQDLTAEPEEPDFVAHGTFVTGAALYGPVSAHAALPTPMVSVDHYRVLPVPPQGVWDVDLFWILDRITEVIQASPNYSLVNLSLGPNLTVDVDAEPHVWTATLDELAAEHGTLFVAAGGNNGDLDHQAGLDRIQVPADMVNGLGVGACDCAAPDEPWARCSYSAVGPGRAGARIQPIGVGFGGEAPNYFGGIVAGGLAAESQGTSFATPAVVHGLAGLAARLGEARSTPHTLRAFAAHFADPLSGNPCEEVGFGRLRLRYDDALECRPEEVTVLYEDAIGRDEVVSLPLPLDEDAVAGRMVSMAWTFAFTTDVDIADPVDYSLAGLELAFRPHARRYRLQDPRTGRGVVLDAGGECS